MKKLAIRLLSILGLAPARSVQSQAQLIADTRAGSLAWKTKAGEAAVRVRALEAEVKQQAQEIQRLKASNEKLRQSQSEIENLLTVRLTDAEQSLTVAREYLMAIDVKLDILEGAANVLDTRTRTVISKARTEVGAPV